MKALLDPASVGEMQTVASWLRCAQAAVPIARNAVEREGRPDRLLRTLTEQNVLLQMRHLRSHPSVAKALSAGALTISGWVYEIGTGEVRIASGSEGGSGHEFAPVEVRDGSSTSAS